MTQTLPAQPAFGGRKVLIAALILGAITAGLVVAYLASQDQDSGLPIDDTIEVVVAREDIAVGATIERSMVEVRELPRTAAMTGAATDTSQVVGQTARYSMVEGEQFSIRRLVEPPKVRSLSFTIPEGMRGFTVPVDITRTPAELIVPGDFVDVIVTFSSVRQLPDGTYESVKVEGGEELESAVTLLQNVQVLAVQKEFVDDGVEYDASTRGEQSEDRTINNVTLSVSPEQAQTLALLSKDGTVTLALRGFGDDANAPLVPVSEPYNFIQPASASTQ